MWCKEIWKNLLRYKKSTEEELASIGILKSNYEQKIRSLEDTCSDLQSKIQAKDKDLGKLNAEKLNMLEELRTLRNSSDSREGYVDEEKEKLLKESIESSEKIKRLKSDVYYRLGKNIGHDKRELLIDVPSKVENISFLHAGGGSSIRGVYKFLYDQTVGDKRRIDSRCLIVDICPDSVMDYVFKRSKVVSGIEWFRKGGDLENYLTDTEDGGVKLLSMGIRYIDEGEFLYYDWKRILEELDNSGYYVYIFGGSISGIVGREVYRSFSGIRGGRSYIVCLGVPTSVRGLILNLRGIEEESLRSELLFFDFIRNSESYFNKLKEKYECVILN